MTSINPWNLEAIEQYRFYCCIECDMKLKESQDFVDHVLLTHAESFRIQTQNNFILDLKVTDSDQVCVVPSIKKKCQQIEKDPVVQLQKLTESKILYHTSPKKDLKDEELFILSEAEDSLDQDQEDNNDHPEWTENELETIGDDVEFKSSETESINESNDLHEKFQIVRRTRNRCKLCKIQFELKSEYNDHIEDTHKVDDGYNCSICQRILPSREKLMNHVANSHKENTKTKCDICQKVLSSRDKWKVHHKVCHKEKKQTKNAKMKVNKKETEVKPKNVETQVSTFGEQTNLPILIPQPSGIPILVMKPTDPITPMIVPIESINEKSNIVVRRTRNRCKSCKIQFKLKSEYNDHIEDKHKNENGYICDLCQKVLPSREKRMNHVANKHPDKPNDQVKLEELREDECNCKIYKNCKKEVKGKYCKLCSTSIHPSGFAKHVKNCKGTWKCPCCSQMIDSTSYFIDEVHSDCKFIVPYNHCIDCHKIISPNNTVNIVRNRKNGVLMEESIDDMDNEVNQPDGFMCLECDYLCSSKSQLLQHMEEVHQLNDNPDQKHCDIEQPEDNSVIEDISMSKDKISDENEKKKKAFWNKDKGRYECQECDKVFDSRSKLYYHVRKDHSEESTTCDTCGKVCGSSHHLYTHIRNCHQTTKFKPEQLIKKCDKCDIEFNKAEELNDHMKTCQKCDKEFKCKECDTIFVSHLALELHYVEEHKKVRFVCDICGYSIYQASILRRHKKEIHDGEKSHICHICGQSHGRKAYLADHLAKYHGIGESRYKCDTCGKIYLTSAQLKNHMEGTHLRDKKYCCDQCIHVSYNISALQKHKRIKHPK